MSVYTSAAATVARQMADKGQLGAIRRAVVTGGGPGDTSGGTAVATDYPVRFVLFPVAQRDIDGTTIKAGDWRAIVDASSLSITPTTTDGLVSSEGVLVIVDAGKFAPAGTVTHYNMVVRK